MQAVFADQMERTPRCSCRSNPNTAGIGGGQALSLGLHIKIDCMHSRRVRLPLAAERIFFFRTTHRAMALTAGADLTKAIMVCVWSFLDFAWRGGEGGWGMGKGEAGEKHGDLSQEVQQDRSTSRYRGLP